MLALVQWNVGILLLRSVAECFATYVIGGHTSIWCNFAVKDLLVVIFETHRVGFDKKLVVRLDIES